jgi:hypothetical protein
MPQD